MELRLLSWALQISDDWPITHLALVCNWPPSTIKAQEGCQDRESEEQTPFQQRHTQATKREWHFIISWEWVSRCRVIRSGTEEEEDEEEEKKEEEENERESKEERGITVKWRSRHTVPWRRQNVYYNKPIADSADSAMRVLLPWARRQCVCYSMLSWRH